jgi:hypothetical protein
MGAFVVAEPHKLGVAMSDEKALLAAICAEPHEDTPRLSK